MNVFFDVDHTLVFVTHDSNNLRPGAHHAMRTLIEAGHTVYVWSAGGKDYVERIVDIHELREFVTECFDKDPRVQPKPDFIIDDDWFLVEKYGGHLVSQYKAVDHTDQELIEAMEKVLATILDPEMDK